MKRKILLVDDDPLIIEVVSFALGGGARHGLLIAENGRTAVTRALEAQPDLILMDVDMPGMSGLEACRALKADPATSAIPVVMLTAMTQSRDVKAGFDAGAVEYITKPFSPTALLKKVDEILATVYPIGTEVRLRDGRVGTIKRRINMERGQAQVMGYHVAVETGTTSTVPADGLEPMG